MLDFLPRLADVLPIASALLALIATIYRNALLLDRRRLEAEKHLRDKVGEIMGRLATTDPPLDQRDRDEFYSDHHEELWATISQHFAKISVRDYATNSEVRKKFLDELRFLRNALPKEGRGKTTLL